MTKEPTKNESSIGVTLSGTPEDGQRVDLATEKALQNFFWDKASRDGQRIVGPLLQGPQVERVQR